MAACLAAVPKTAINEHGKLLLMEIQIWIAGQVSDMKFPAADSRANQRHSKRTLC